MMVGGDVAWSFVCLHFSSSLPLILGLGRLGIRGLEDCGGCSLFAVLGLGLWGGVGSPLAVGVFSIASYLHY